MQQIKYKKESLSMRQLVAASPCIRCYCCTVQPSSATWIRCAKSFIRVPIPLVPIVSCHVPSVPVLSCAMCHACQNSRVISNTCLRCPTCHVCQHWHVPRGTRASSVSSCATLSLVYILLDVDVEWLIWVTHLTHLSPWRIVRSWWVSD